MALVDKNLFLTLLVISLFLFLPKQYRYSKYNILIITFLIVIIYLLVDKWEILNFLKIESFETEKPAEEVKPTEEVLKAVEDEMEIELEENKINKSQGFDAIVVPNAKNFWVKDEYGYFDIGNANTEKYIVGDSNALKETADNYTIEMWIRPQYFGNPYIMSVADGVNRGEKSYFAIKIDEQNIYIEDDTEEHRIPYVPGEWMQFVIVRGTEDRVATDLGRLFKNGTYLQTSNKVKRLNVARDGGWIFFQDPNKLGLNNNQYLSSNPSYQNRSSFGVFRLYNRSLSEVEISNNFNTLSGRYRLMTSGEPDYIKSGLICDLDASNPRSYPGNGNVWYDIAKNEGKKDKVVAIFKGSQYKNMSKSKANKMVEEYLAKKEELKMTVPKPNKSVIKQETDLNRENNIGQIVDDVSGKCVAIADKQGTIQELDIPMTPLVGVPVVAVWKTARQDSPSQQIQPNVSTPLVTPPVTTQVPTGKPRKVDLSGWLNF